MNIDASIIGILTAAVATTYIVFLVYFDWMKTPYLPPVRQMLWTIIHFPFHLALVLFMQGFTQFIQWSKVVDVLNHLSTNWLVFDTDQLPRTTSEMVQQNMTDELSEFFTTYPPEYSDTGSVITDALGNITDIPNAFWPKLAKFILIDDYELPDDKTTNLFFSIINDLTTAMENAVFSTFEIDLEGEALKEMRESGEESNESAAAFATNIDDETWERYNLVVCSHSLYLSLTFTID